MAVVREGNKTVLVIVDVQVGVVQEAWNAPQIINNIEAANVIRELNIAMTWLRYPGRVNDAASVEEFDFADLGE